MNAKNDPSSVLESRSKLVCVSYLAKMYQIANIFLAVNLIGWFECFLIQECVSYYSNPVIHVVFNNRIKDGSSTFEFKLLISNTLKLIISRIESVLGVKMFLIKKILWDKLFYYFLLPFCYSYSYSYSKGCNKS